jgi:hypothetical protein
MDAHPRPSVFCLTTRLNPRSLILMPHDMGLSVVTAITYRFGTLLVLAAVLLGCGGCIFLAFPTGKKTISGPLHSSEALAFLSLPGATRDDAVSSLGPPDIELSASRILAYVCQSGTKWWTAISFYDPFEDEFGPFETAKGVAPSARRVLMVAYDEEGQVYAHKQVRLADGSVEAACLRWEKSLRATRLK